MIDNSRHISLDFDIQNDALLHGFSGYFETVLYGDINLSKSNILGRKTRKYFDAHKLSFLNVSSNLHDQTLDKVKLNSRPLWNLHEFHEQPVEYITTEFCFHKLFHGNY